MKPGIIDATILIAALDSTHYLHSQAHAWFQSATNCRIAYESLIELIETTTDPSKTANPLSLEQTKDTLKSLNNTIEILYPYAGSTKILIDLLGMHQAATYTRLNSIVATALAHEHNTVYTLRPEYYTSHPIEAMNPISNL